MAAESRIVSGTPTSTTYGVPGTEQITDATFGASRVILKPTDFAFGGYVGGHYRVAASTGALTGVAAAGAIFSARWSPGSTNSYALLKRVQIASIITTAFTTAQAIDFDIVTDRAFTAADTGGTPITPILGNSQKNRSSIMNTSQMTDMRIATTGALGAGTKTADASAMGITCHPNNNSIGSGSALIDLYKEDVQAAHPVMFGNNEGFNIRMVTAMGAVGVIKVYVVVEWAEVPGL